MARPYLNRLGLAYPPVVHNIDSIPLACDRRGALNSDGSTAAETERPRTGHDRWSWWAAAAALVVGVLIAFQDVLALGRGLVFRDHILVFRPRAFGIVQALSDGRWPGLTRSSPIGVPLEVQLNGTWTPPTALLFFGDVDVAYDAFVMAHYVLLGVGVLLLARAFGASPLTGLVGAVIAVLSGPTISSENLVVMLQGLAWVPWIGLGLHRLATKRSWWATAGTALAVGFHLQAIVPVVLALDLVFVLVLAATLRPKRRSYVLATIAGLWGLGIASLELMPLLTILGETERGQGFAYEAQSGWALSPGMMIELLVPSFWAPPEIPVLNAPVITGRGDDPPYFGCLYLGTVIPLVLAGGFRGRARQALWAIVVVAFIVAMGRHTPVHRWVVSLPILASSRYAVKYTLLVAAGLAGLGALALPVVLERPRRLILVAFAHFIVLMIAVSVVRSPEYRAALDWLVVPLKAGIVLTDVDLRAAMHAGQLSRLYWAMTGAGLMVAAAAAVFRWGPRGGFTIAAVLVLDLAVAASFGVRGANLQAKQLLGPAQAKLTDAQQRYFIEDRGRLPPIAHRPSSTHFDDMMRSLGRRGHHAYPIARLAVGIELDGLGNPVNGRVMKWALTADRPAAYRMMARLGVARVLSPYEDLPLERIFSWPIEGEPDQHLYRLDGVRPYVSAFTTWSTVPPERLNPFAHRRHLMRSDDHAIVTAGLTASSTVGCARPPMLEWAQPNPERITGRVESACPAVVVVQEVAVPGWVVRIDDEPATVVEAEAGYVGVFVPAGAHEFEVRFEHRSRPWALLSGVTGLAALVAWLLGWGFEGRRRKAAAP